jgi:hypothetical protein
MKAFLIEMTSANGDKEFVGDPFSTREAAERARVERTYQGQYTDGRDVYGDLYAPNVTRVVEVTR